jgi:hypothetical protein
MEDVIETLLMLLSYCVSNGGRVAIHRNPNLSMLDLMHHQHISRSTWWSR